MINSGMINSGMINSGISGMLPSMSAAIAKKLRQPDATSQAAALKTVDATTVQIAAALDP